jgi:dTDP-4-amino-4,6-dideoxygalactose transaminase
VVRPSRLSPLRGEPPDHDRDKVAKELAERAVQAGIDYPRPVHLQRAYFDLQEGAGLVPPMRRR